MTPRPIADLVESVSTWIPSRASPSETIRYIELSAVDQDRKTISGAKLITTVDAPSRARQLVRADDVLVSTVRPNLNGVARVPSELDGAVASTGFCVLRPQRSRLDASYLFHWVKGPQFVGEMVRQATGASYPAVTDRVVLSAPMPVPSLSEQRRIADILDKADALRAKRREALAELDRLTQAIFTEMFGDPVANERGWERFRLGDLLENIESGVSPVCLDRPAIGDEWGVLKLGAVTRCEYDDSENKALPPNVRPDEAIEVLQGDLLFSRKNTYDLVGACAYVKSTRPKLMLPDLIFRLKFRDAALVEPRYLHRLLVHPAKRLEFKRLASGSAGSMPNISKARLLGATVEIPPLVLQRKFAERLGHIEIVQSMMGTAAEREESLFASLQHRAFRGEL